MKIGIFGFANLRFMPYLKFYLNCIDCNEHEVHVIYWDRKLIDEPQKENIIYHKLSIPMLDELRNFEKIEGFLKYKMFATKIINKEKFDFIITLHTFPPVLLKNILIKQYSNRYIFDYRDYTCENIYLFKKIIHRLAEESKCTFVSSDAFRQYMPNDCSHKIYTSHNLQLEDLNHKKSFRKKKGVLKIAYWGFIRELDANIKMIRHLGNDERFELHYYGKDGGIVDQLKKVVFDIKSDNVYFHGEYLQNERYEFGGDCDLVHNLYTEIQTKNAVGNKYYDALIFGKPQICAQGMYMGYLVEKNKVGIALDLERETFADELYSYYESLNENSFVNSVNIELDRVVNEFKQGEEIIIDTINNKL